jgi:hypothetical protein
MHYCIRLSGLAGPVGRAVPIGAGRHLGQEFVVVGTGRQWPTSGTGWTRWWEGHRRSTKRIRKPDTASRRCPSEAGGAFAASRCDGPVFPGHGLVQQGVNPEYMTQACGFFERALAINPRSVEALVGMARVDLSMGAFALTDDRAARYSAAETNAIKALSLAPDHAWAPFCLGCRVRCYKPRCPRDR